MTWNYHAHGEESVVAFAQSKEHNVINDDLYQRTEEYKQVAMFAPSLSCYSAWHWVMCTLTFRGRTCGEVISAVP